MTAILRFLAALARLLFGPWRRRAVVDLPADWLRDNSLPIGGVPVPRRPFFEGNLAFIGGAGSGKTTLLIAILLRLALSKPSEIKCRNLFIYSPKNDLGPVLRSAGLSIPVINANPLHQDGAVWDPALDIDDPFLEESFGDFLIPEDEKGDQNKFYRDAPCMLLIGVVRVLNERMPRRWTPRQVYLILMRPDLMRRLFRSSRNPQVRALLQLLDDEQGSTFANIRSSLLTKTRVLWYLAILFESCRKRYSIRTLVRSECATVFGSDPRYATVLDAINALQVVVLARELLSQGDSFEREHIVCIDELARLISSSGKLLEVVSELVEWGRSRGVRAIYAIQTTAQLTRHGKEVADILLGQCRNKILLKCLDATGSDAASQALGRARGYEWTFNVSSGPSGAGGGASEQYFDRPLVYPDEIAELPVASRRHGIHGYAHVPGIGKWRFLLDKHWISEHVVDPDPRIRPYDECRKDLRGRSLEPLQDGELDGLRIPSEPEDLGPPF